MAWLRVSKPCYYKIFHDKEAIWINKPITLREVPEIDSLLNGCVIFRLANCFAICQALRLLLQGVGQMLTYREYAVLFSLKMPCP